MLICTVCYKMFKKTFLADLFSSASQSSEFVWFVCIGLFSEYVPAPGMA